MEVGQLQPDIKNDFTARLMIWDRPPPGWDGEHIEDLFAATGTAPEIQGFLRITFEPFEPDDRPQRIRTMTLQPTVPTTPKDVAGLPWTRLLHAAEALVMAQQRNSIQAWQDNAQAAQIATGSPARTRRGGKPLGDEHYAQVAQRYVDLSVAGRVADNGKADPIVQIAAEHGVKRNTAAAWVNRARKKGLLGPANTGKAG